MLVSNKFFYSPQCFLQESHENVRLFSRRLNACRNSVFGKKKNENTNRIEGFRGFVKQTQHNLGYRNPIVIIALNPFPNKLWFLCICSRSLLETL